MYILEGATGLVGIRREASLCCKNTYLGMIERVADSKADNLLGHHVPLECQAETVVVVHWSDVQAMYPQ